MVGSKINEVTYVKRLVYESSVMLTLQILLQGCRKKKKEKGDCSFPKF